MYQVATFAVEKLEHLDKQIQDFLNEKVETVITLSHAAFNPSFQRNGGSFTAILIFIPKEDEQESIQVAKKGGQKR